jgi:hypothetical protein
VLLELAESKSIGEKIATVDVEKLAQSQDVAFDMMRNQIRSVLGRNAGTGGGNRTLDSSLGSSRFTTKLRPLF